MAAADSTDGTVPFDASIPTDVAGDGIVPTEETLIDTIADTPTETDASGLPSWFTAWRDAIHLRGGKVTRWPTAQDQVAVDTGDLINPRGGALAGHFTTPADHYEMAPFVGVRVRDYVNRIPDSALDEPYTPVGAFSFLEKVSNKIDDYGSQVVAPVIQSVSDEVSVASVASGVASAAGSVANSVFGIPGWLTLAVGAVVLYGVGVQAGLLPPMRKLLK